jgi:hypothetical protein
MKLPNADNIVVEREKIVDYLLNPAHRYGASKARFFSRVGFRAEKWEQLAQALRRHGQSHEVKRARETGFGPRYEVEGELHAPDGRSPRLRSVWQLDHGEVGWWATLKKRIRRGRRIQHARARVLPGEE